MACCGCYQIADDGSCGGAGRRSYELFERHRSPGRGLIDAGNPCAHTLAATPVFRRKAVIRGYRPDWFLPPMKIYRQWPALECGFCPIRLFTLSPRRGKRAQQVVAQHLYPVQFRKDTTLRFWQASLTQRLGTCVASLGSSSSDTRIAEPLAPRRWGRADLALAWDRSPDRPPPLPPWARAHFDVDWDPEDAHRRASPSDGGAG